MHEVANHLTTVELEQGLPEVLASPRDAGHLEAIVVRPAENKRVTIDSARLTLVGGIEGDRWASNSYYRLENGDPDPRCQVSLMNARFLRQIAGEEDAMCLAGDNLIVDLDLSAENLPVGSRLTIGPDVVVAISDLPHTGCSKLAKRYGDASRAFMNAKHRKNLHLRGRYAAIIHGGTIRVGDKVVKVTAE
jgi:MOSC domain-containing protein YiiM